MLLLAVHQTINSLPHAVLILRYTSMHAILCHRLYPPSSYPLHHYATPLPTTMNCLWVLQTVTLPLISYACCCSLIDSLGFLASSFDSNTGRVIIWCTCSSGQSCLSGHHYSSQFWWGRWRRARYVAVLSLLEHCLINFICRFYRWWDKITFPSW